jgi:hypothetical protein
MGFSVFGGFIFSALIWLEQGFRQKMSAVDGPMAKVSF